MRYSPFACSTWQGIRIEGFQFLLADAACSPWLRHLEILRPRRVVVT